MWGALAWAVAVGVLIDLDHFIIARLRTGNWKSARFCLHNPYRALTDQHLIFELGDVGVLERLLSHLLLTGLALALLVYISVPIAILTGVVLYVHIVSDVCWDIWRLTESDTGSIPEQRI